MNREILFRGKTKNRKNNDWIYGSLVRGVSKYDYEPTTFIYELHTEIDGRGWIDNYWGEEVDPETVGQYTGLTDINGVKIFEGDVFSNRHVVTYLANYNDGLGMNAGWYTQRDNFESWSELECEQWHEVLGNKWDNPELVEVQ